jgi:hypothetical protein
MKPWLRILEIEIDFSEVNIIERMQYFRNDKIRFDRRKFAFNFGRSSTMKKDCDFFPIAAETNDAISETKEQTTCRFILKQILYNKL